MTTICRGAAAFEPKIIVPLTEGWPTQAILEFFFYKEAANMYQKTFTPFDIGAADAHANLECPFYKEVADMCQNSHLL